MCGRSCVAMLRQSSGRESLVAVPREDGLLAPELRLVFWNALKLASFPSDTNARPSALFDGLLTWLATHDIIALTEVPAGTGRARLEVLLRSLNEQGDGEGEATPQWHMLLSEPSGASTSRASRSHEEHHAVLWRRPWSVERARTLHKIESGASSVRMGHAPFVVKFRRQPATPATSATPVTSATSLDAILTLTVAHLPPPNRTNDRNVEFRALVRHYPSVYRSLFGGSFDRETHVIAADFNMHPASHDALSADWSVALPPGVSTMSNAESAYDNFLVNRHASRTHHVDARVQRLRRMPEGKFPSDHCPVELRLVPRELDVF